MAIEDKILNAIEFQENLDSFTGHLYVSNENFIDKKFLEVLEHLRINYNIILIKNLQHKVIKRLDLEIGPNFLYIEDGVVKHKLTSMASPDIILNFISMK